MKYSVEKSKVPILWLDTFFITQIATALFFKNTNQPHNERIINIYSDLVMLRQEGKIIIFESSQILEIAVRKELIKISGEVLTKLSGGVRVDYFDVQNKQITQAINASINKSKTCTLSWRDIFRCNPLEDQSVGGILVRCDLALDVRTKNSCKTIDVIYDQWNNIRDKHILNGEKRNFTKQLELEKTGANRLTRDALEAVRNRTEKWPSLYLIYYEYVKRFAGLVKMQKPDIADTEQYVVDFYNTDYYFDLPFVDIQSTLFAERLCGHELFKKSDQADIDNISMFLPYVTYILPDKAMKDKIEKHRIDKKYNTKVLRISDLELIIKDIQGEQG
jgi:hypothetical protein